MTIYGKITYSLCADGFGDDATEDIAEMVGGRIMSALREYLDSEYPGNLISIIPTHDTGDVTSQDYINDDDGEDLPEVTEVIEAFLERAFADPMYWK